MKRVLLCWLVYVLSMYPCEVCVRVRTGVERWPIVVFMVKIEY